MVVEAGGLSLRLICVEAGFLAASGVDPRSGSIWTLAAQKVVEPAACCCDHSAVNVNNTAEPIKNLAEQASACRELIADDFARVDQLIRDKLASDVVLINQMSTYIVNNGGKRLRPQVVLFAAGACGYQGGLAVNLAAIVEFIHTATLLHDDVVDESALRRGQDTANSVWGNEAAVLVGDFLYSRSFEMMVEVGEFRVMEILAATTNRIAEGEVMQLLNVHEPDLSVDQYLEVVRAKTAKLFEAAARLGAVISGSGPVMETALAEYGMHLGTAFQIADDVLDYVSDADQLGKNIGDDLAEGKPTLPIILAMQRCDQNKKAILADAIREGGLDDIQEVLTIVSSCGAIEASMQRARQESVYAREAVSKLPDNPYKDALGVLADYAVARLS